LDAEQVEVKGELFVAIGIKMNTQKWMKYESQVGELDQLKLKTVVL